jgi:predicted CopG family antitoxin
MNNVNIQYRNIVVTDKNYRKLKGLGSAGDSFNDVITDLLEKINSLQQSQGRELQ